MLNMVEFQGTDFLAIQAQIVQDQTNRPAAALVRRSMETCRAECADPKTLNRRQVVDLVQKVTGLVTPTNLPGGTGSTHRIFWRDPKTGFEGHSSLQYTREEAESLRKACLEHDPNYTIFVQDA